MTEVGSEKDLLNTWDYETRFREYALLLGRKGTEALESIDNFPEQIKLDSVWHNALDRMRDETNKDGNERYALIGSREHRDFYFPEIFTKGEPNQIPEKLLRTEMM